MNILITTKEQLIELAARGIYLLSSLRYWEKCFDEEPSVEVKKIVQRDKHRIDEWLDLVGAVEYQPLKEIIEQLKLQTKIENETSRTEQL